MNNTITIEQFDLNEAQARLNALPGSSDNVLESNIWKFKDAYGEFIYIEFNDLLDVSESHPNWLLSSNAERVLIIKLMWLSLDSVKVPNTYSMELNNLKLFWSAIANLNLTQVTRENCHLVLTYLLMHGWRQGSASKNQSIKSYSLFFRQMQFLNYRSAIAKYGYDCFSRDLTESYIRKQVQELIPALTDDELTYHDWLQGGTHNQLGLDYGRYYVEHCITFFENNYPLAKALASTFKAIPEIASSAGYSQNTIKLTANMLLSGHSPEELNQRQNRWTITTLQNTRKALEQYFLPAYKQALFEAAILRDNNLQRFTVACGLQDNSENIDRMRVILWDWIRRKNKQETLSLLIDCQKPIAWQTFQIQLAVIENKSDQQTCQMPTAQNYKQIGLTAPDVITTAAHTYPRQLIRLVAQSGLTAVVALTGWRRSEFGFSHSDIKRTRNSDKLDQYAFPWRYQVDWYVYKSHGMVRQKREITFNINVLTEQLQSLHSATDEQPSLYSYTRAKKFPTRSKAIVQLAVSGLWENYVHNYEGFKLLDDWTTWKSLQYSPEKDNSLTAEEQQEVDRLLTLRSAEEWANLSIETNLKEAWYRTRDEWPRVKLFFTKSKKRIESGWLKNYLNRTLRSDWQDLLDKHLSEEIKDWLHTLPAEDLKSMFVTRTVTSSVMEGTLYPTPHSFRHMWAEAIYRRFDGDAGWMIRSQFKHITRTMWLAYIRNKDNRRSHKFAKEQVISSLVQNYVRHQGKGYAGQLNTWLRRIFRKTTIALPEEQEQIVKHLTKFEIEDIKANPWGYCILKFRTRDKAKCAEMGEPMRHNASPDLCSGCVHNLMQTENVEWSLFHIAPHLETLRNPVVPAIFKASSYELVKNITKHVRTLNPKHEALTELVEVIASYKATRAV